MKIRKSSWWGQKSKLSKVCCVTYQNLCEKGRRSMKKDSAQLGLLVSRKGPKTSRKRSLPRISYFRVVLEFFFSKIAFLYLNWKRKWKSWNTLKGNIFIVWDWKTELSFMRRDSNGVRLYEGLLGIPPDLEPSPSALFPAAVWNFFFITFFSLNHHHWIIDVHLLQQQQMARTRTRSSSTAGEKEFWIYKV